MEQSKRWQWNQADTIAFINNALWFLTPTLIVLLPSIAGALPPEWQYTAIAIFLLNRATDFLRRWYNGPIK